MSHADRPQSDPSPRPSAPREFSRGIGFVMQAIGASIFLVTTCLCCGLAFVEGGMAQTRNVTVPLEHGHARIEPGRPGEPATLDLPRETPVGYTLLLSSSAVGGLALVGFGLGMQADRGAFPAAGATLTTGAMAVAYATAAVLLWRDETPWPFAVMAGAFALASLGGLGLAVAGLSEVLEHPPETTGPPPAPPDTPLDPLASPTGVDLEAELERRRKAVRRQLESLRKLEEKSSRGDQPITDDPNPPDRRR